MADPRGPHAAREAYLLPEFCSERAALILVLGAELVAIALALLGAGSALGFWSRLAWFSLLVQWIAIASAALLCAFRPWLARCNAHLANAVSVGTPVLVTLLVSDLSWRGLAYFELDLGMRVGSHGVFLARNAGLALLVAFVTLRYLVLQQRWRREVAAEAEARVEALTARINPHFLFNTLNTVLALTRDRPALAERVLEDLADLFRVALKDARSLAPLGDELALARAYLGIEELRLGPRLRVAWQVDGVPEDALAPRLALQPLVENAVFHGVELLPAGGEIAVSGGRDGESIWLAVANPRPPTAARPAEGRGVHLALDNVRQRIALAFGGAGRLEVEAAEEHFQVTVRFPYRRPGDALSS